jgi:hypothetical protein
MRFLRENWIWIAIPFAIAAAFVCVVFFLGGSGSDSPFVYNVF